MPNLSTAQTKVAAAFRELLKAQDKSDRATNARAALPPGSSRAKVTTANARWATTAEDRDRRAEALWRALREALMVLANVTDPPKKEPIPKLKDLGCLDSACPFTRHLGGMRTNGGCRCFLTAMPNLSHRCDVLLLLAWTKETGIETGRRLERMVSHG